MSDLPAAKAILALLLSAALGSCRGKADLVLDPPEWGLGSIPSNQAARSEIVIRNRDPRAVALRFLSTCDCLQVEEGPGELAGGAAAPMRLSYDPAGQSGFVEAALVVIARQGRRESRLALRVHGKVLPAGEAQPAP